MTKKFYEMTESEMLAQIKTGTVKHRRCDICGCGLALPDVGPYIREGLNTVACTGCTNTRPHLDLLGYIEDLKKSHSKKEILEILDKRMEDTWSSDSSIFTVEEWKEQTKDGDKND